MKDSGKMQSFYMQRIHRFFLFACLLVPMLLWAQTQPPSQNALLWKLERQGFPISYIFGTMHSDDPNVLKLLGKLNPYLHDVHTVCTEMMMNFQSLIRANEAMYFHDGQTLTPILGQSLFDKSVQALRLYGLGKDAADQLKPWAVIAILSTPRNISHMVLDKAIFDDAQRHDKDVCGLETIQEQVEVFAGMSKSDQIEILKETLVMFPKIHDAYASLLQAYLKQDLAQLAHLSDLYGVADQSLKERFMHRLIDDRNTRMLKRMLSRMQTYASLFAVGALHLPGSNGLLTLLEIEGFKVTPLKLK